MGLLIGWIIGCGLIKFIKLIFNLIKLIFYIVIILCGAIYKAVQVLFKLCKNSYRLGAYLFHMVYNVRVSSKIRIAESK
mgnify:CR=1 FL=1